MVLDSIKVRFLAILGNLNKKTSVLQQFSTIFVKFKNILKNREKTFDLKFVLMYNHNCRLGRAINKHRQNR